MPDGTTIYAQYREKDGTLSPVYSAKTHTLEGGINGGEGVYVFEFPTYVDEDGNEHDFGYVGQQVRVWAENYTDENGVRHVATAGAPGNVPGEFGRVAIGSNGSLHNPAAHSVTNTYVGFVSQPNANFGGDPDDVIVDERGPLGKDANTNSDAVNDHSISGNVFFNTEESGGDIINIANGDGAEPLEGYTVKVATLTDEGARANEELKASNDPSEWPRLTQELIASNPESSPRLSRLRPTRTVTTPSASRRTSSSTPSTSTPGLRTRAARSSRRSAPSSSPTSPTRWRPPPR